MGIQYTYLLPFFLLDHMDIPLVIEICSIVGSLTIRHRFLHILHKLVGMVVVEQYISFDREYMFLLDI
jgi:hypothetical protein